MGGGQILGNGGEVVKQALVGQEEIGAEVMVQTEGMLQTVVRHQECPALRDHEGHRQDAVGDLILETISESLTFWTSSAAVNKITLDSLRQRWSKTLSNLILHFFFFK